MRLLVSVVLTRVSCGVWLIVAIMFGRATKGRRGGDGGTELARACDN